jgi:hypothetical protein
MCRLCVRLPTTIFARRKKLKTSLEEFKAAAMASHGSRTDILGAVALAQQEFKFHAGSPKKSIAAFFFFI